MSNAGWGLPGLLPGGVRGVRMHAAPSPPLRDHVLGYFGSVHGAQLPAEMRVVPIGSVLLMFEFDPAPGQVVDGGRRFRLPVQSVFGLHDHQILVRPRPAKGFVIAVLTPPAAHCIFGVAQRELANSFTGVTDILGGRARLLAEQLAETSDWSARFALLDRTLAAWMAHGRASAPAIMRAWRRLHESGGQLRIGDLAAEIGTSRRYLEMRFAEQVGLAPKTVARIARFHNAARLATMTPRRDLAELACACGYSDHAHLDREFREFSGCTPTEFLAQSTLGVVNGVTGTAGSPGRPGYRGR